ncbi:MAG: hypothetical protein SGPRY_009964 [Prymnesium sp.]
MVLYLLARADDETDLPRAGCYLTAAVDIGKTLMRLMQADGYNPALATPQLRLGTFQGLYRHYPAWADGGPGFGPYGGQGDLGVAGCEWNPEIGICAINHKCELGERRRIATEDLDFGWPGAEVECAAALLHDCSRLASHIAETQRDTAWALTSHLLSGDHAPSPLAECGDFKLEPLALLCREPTFDVVEAAQLKFLHSQVEEFVAEIRGDVLRGAISDTIRHTRCKLDPFGQGRRAACALTVSSLEMLVYRSRVESARERDLASERPGRHAHGSLQDVARLHKLAVCGVETDELEVVDERGVIIDVKWC